MLSKPEILAPAGSFGAVSAAVNAGADAVYLGGSSFSARAFAGNFDDAELIRAIDYCHIHDVRVYLAINTLLKNDEIARLPGYVEPFCREGVDGVIVQDVGVLSVLSRCFPDLPLHGSTQMSVSSEYGAEFLKSLGMTRLVPSRELSLSELKNIKSRVDIELETFVHGAMCYSYSGRCLMSSFAGGRSGNRGRCAQPCRKLYSVEGRCEYALSMKDMCTLESLGALIDAGIDSFKIEGRMKKPEYVAASVLAYRSVRDAYLSGEDAAGRALEQEKILLDVYNRGGFCQGYYFAKNGRDMLASERPNHTGIRIGTVKRVQQPFIDIELCEAVSVSDVLEVRARAGNVELTCNTAGEAGDMVRLRAKNFKLIHAGGAVYRTRNNRLLTELSDMKPSRKRLNARVTAHVGKELALVLETEDGKTSVEVMGDVCCRAQSRPVTREQLMDKISRTGDSHYEFGHIEVYADDDIFVRIGSVNELRRTALSKMDELLAGAFARSLKVRRDTPECPENTPDCGIPDELKGITVYVSTAEQVSIVKNYKWCSNVIVDYNIRECAALLEAEGFRVIYALPEVLRAGSKALKDGARSVLALGLKSGGVMVKTLDELGMLRQIGYNGMMVMAPGMYAYNDEAISFYREHADKICFMASDELTLGELARLNRDVLIKLYGHQRVMVTAGCVKSNYDRCVNDDKKSCVIPLTDEKGNSFYAVNFCEDCYNVIYNGVPTSLIDRYGELLRSKRDCYIEFTVEGYNTVEKVMDAAWAALSGQKGAALQTGGFTRGHYYKGID